MTALVAGIAAAGYLISIIPQMGKNLPEDLKKSAVFNMAPQINYKSHGPDVSSEQITPLFEKAVSMLRAKKFEHAIIALHKVLKIAPRLTEAHVNMGFAFYGIKRFDEARDFFTSAIDLRPTQVNAYYGLAISLKETNDLKGAVGAMRSYLHLKKKEDSYSTKARSILVQWEGEIIAEEKESKKGG